MGKAKKQVGVQASMFGNIEAVKPAYLVLYESMEKDWTESWAQLWDQFENYGCILYCTATYNGNTYQLLEFGFTGVKLSITGKFENEIDIFTWGEKDITNAKTKRKILAALKEYLGKNYAQII